MSQALFSLASPTPAFPSFRKAWLLTIAAGALALLPMQSHAQTAGNLSGTLLFNGVAIQGTAAGTLYVNVPGATGNYANTSGVYAFSTLAPGAYTETVYDSGCSPSSTLGQKSVTVTGGNTTTANIDLAATAGLVQGTIYQNGSATTSNFTINTLCGQFQTASDGTFTHYLAPGSYTGSVNNASGASIRSFSFTITAGQATNVGNIFVTTGAVGGTVLWNGAAVSTSAVTTMLASIANAGSSAVTTTGTYNLAGLSPGSYTLKLYGNNCSPAIQFASTSVSATGGQSSTVNLDITSATGRVSGTVLVNGVAQPNPVISISGACQQWVTQSNGTFLQYLLPGSYTATVAANSGTIGTFNFTITAGQTNNVGSINFQTGNLAVPVTFNGAAIGSPNIAKLYAFVNPGSTPLAGAYLDSSQSQFTFNNLSPGSYTIGIYQNNCVATAGQLTTFSATATGGNTSTTRVELSSGAGLVTGTATVNGTALPNPQISISGQCGTWASRSDGTYFHYLPPGTYTAQVAGPSGSLGAISFTITAGQTTVANFGGASLASTTTTLTSSANPATVGQPVTLTATVTGSSPTGSVSFYDGSTLLTTATLSSARATYTTSSLTAGSHALSAVYGGDAGNATSTSPTLTQAMNAAPLFASTAVGTAAAQMSATFTITTGTTLPALSNANVLTQGAPSLDFTLGTGSTCTGAVTAGSTCTINVLFTPKAPGLRRGAVNLLSSTGTILATIFTSGIGTGPQLLSTQNTQVAAVTGLNHLNDVVVDAAGNLYFADYGTGIVGKVAAGASTPTTLATTSGPAGLAIDGAGNIFFGSNSNGRLYELLGGTGSAITIATFASPEVGMATDAAGNVYAVSSSLGYAQKFLAGTFTASTTYASGLSHAAGVALDPSGNVYLADYANNKIYKVNPDGTSPTVIISTNLSGPIDLTVDAAGDIYASNLTNSTLFRFTAGTYAATQLTGSFNQNTGLAIDASGNLFVNQIGTGHIDKFPRATLPTLNFPNTTAGSTSATQTVTLENDGNAALTVPIPAGGQNPSLSSYFTQSNSSTCPLAYSTSGNAGTLASAATCTEILAFAPATSGAVSGLLTFTDNNLNTPASTQSIHLAGATASVDTVTVDNESVVQGSATVALLFAYGTGGNTPPTGTPTLTVNGSATGVGTIACNTKTGHKACTVPYNPSSLAPASYTISVTVPADSNYPTATKTGTLTVTTAGANIITPPVQNTIAPVETLTQPITSTPLLQAPVLTAPSIADDPDATADSSSDAPARKNDDIHP